jgi:predicted 2-oxoglutarate/Fe(II)-dependent dioxygenase YbiX
MVEIGLALAADLEAAAKFTMKQGTLHMAHGYRDNSTATRKLSMVLQLSDPSEYEGGELQILDKANPETVTKQKGMITVFPSYTLHQVTPVTGKFND